MNPAGKVFWVDENGGGGSKGTFDHPIASIDAALSQCVAGRGDVIMVKPGHVENISAAGDLTLDVIGVSIVGTGNGDDQAKIEWDTADTADIDVTVANCTIANMWLYNNYANVDGAIDVAATGTYFTIDGCRWTCGTNILDVEEGINIAAAANYFKFTNNDVIFPAGADTESLVLTAGECINMHVEGNTICMDCSAAIFDLDATALTGTPLFRNNTMVLLTDTTTGLIVAINNATVGVFVNERYASNKGNTEPVADPAASYLIHCHGSELNDVGSLLFPATATVW